VLFINALATTEGGWSAGLFAGLAAATAGLAVLFYFINLIAQKIPLRPLFIITSAFLFAMAIKFIGEAVQEFQEQAILPFTELKGAAWLGAIGLNPTVEALSAFDAAVDAVRVAPSDQRGRRTRQLVAAHGGKQAVREGAVLELLRLVRDNLGWQDVLDYVETLPDAVRRHPLVVEQQLLARSKLGDPAGAVGALKELITRLGATSERQGLLGGRYKQLMNAATNDHDRRRYLDLAIEAYEVGMTLDLNDYYPMSNLPRLYRLRAEGDDQQRAMAAATVTVAACQRALALGRNHEWARQTLLGAAFDAGDAERARSMLPQVEREGSARWMVSSTLSDLEIAVTLQPDAPTRRELGEILLVLRAIAEVES